MCRAFAIALAVSLPAAGHAETVVGYQVGASGSVAGQVTDNDQLFVDQQVGAERQGQTFTGLRTTLAAAGNLSIDVLARAVDQAFVLGIGYNQMIPALVPNDVNAQLEQGPGALNANANYMLRVVRPGYGFGLGAGYGFATAGRVATEADGTAAAVADVGNTQPGQDIGGALINGISHTAVARGQFQILRRDWDVNVQANYSYIDNGIFALAGGERGVDAEGNFGNATGQFVSSNAHVLALDVEARAVIQRRNNLVARVQGNLTLPEFRDPPRDENGQILQGFAGVRALNETLVLGADLSYFYAFNQQRRLGLRAGGNLSFRTPANGRGEALLTGPTAGASQCPITDANSVVDDTKCGEFVDPLQVDALIWRTEAFYADQLPWRVGLTVAAGVAQARLLQAPPGAQGEPDPALGGFFINASEFRGVTSNIEPIFSVTLGRDFEPIAVAITGARQVGPGTLGAAAVATWLANVTFTGQIQIDMLRALRMNLGFAYTQTDGVGTDLFPTCPADPTVPRPEACVEGISVAAFDNRSFGANLNLALPLFSEGGVGVDMSLAYTFRYADLNPNNDPQVALLVSEPFFDHTAFLILAMSFARGTLQGRNQAFDPATMDAFSANPRTGSPLVSATLMNQGAQMVTGTEGARPGQMPDPNSRAAIEAQLERSERQEQVELEAMKRLDAVKESDDIVEAEAEALDAAAEEAAKRRGKRTREFGQWPMDALPLPETSEPPEDAPPP